MACKHAGEIVEYNHICKIINKKCVLFTPDEQRCSEHSGGIIRYLKAIGTYDKVANLPQAEIVKPLNFPECENCICSKCNDTYCKTEACMETCINYGKAYPSEHCQNEPQC